MLPQIAQCSGVNGIQTPHKICRPTQRMASVQIVPTISDGMPNAKPKPCAQNTSRKSVSPPGRAARMTLRINLPRTSSWFGSSARKNAGAPMVAKVTRDSCSGWNG